MNKFSRLSAERLSTCHADLQMLFTEVLKYKDCTVICGYRGEKAQNEAVKNGNSKLAYPKSKHNFNPSNAVDVAPFPLNWDKVLDFVHFAGFVLGIAQKLFEQKKIRHKIKWGGDWNQNGLTSDERFVDASHFEIIV